MAIIAPVPVTLTNGTTGDATQVMADFNFIVSQVNANAAALVGPQTFTGQQIVPPATGRTNIPQAGQVQDSSFTWCGTATGTANALLLTPAPAITSYTAGQEFSFIVGLTNTAAATVNVSGVGVLAITKNGNLALVANDLPAGWIAHIQHDGTQFELLTVRPYAQGANIASAGTINLDTATGDYVHLTGAATITAITLAQGQQRTTVTDGTAAFTNSASLILLGNANITAAAGDTQVWRGEAAGVVRMISYARFSGATVKGTPNTRTVIIAVGAGTYTTPVNCTSINVRIRGSGGGGSGGNSVAAGATGGNTTFGTLTANGGVGGAATSVGGGAGGAGGGASGGDININGSAGNASGQCAQVNVFMMGAPGGPGEFGGAGAGGQGGANSGGNAPQNTGGGGGGGGGNSASMPGAGGGAGGYCEKRFTPPAATYAYSISGGGGGTGGTSLGGNGGTGIIMVEESYP